MQEYKREFIRFLESAGVLKFGDFTAKSGRKIPYFINAGEIKTGGQIRRLGEFYARAYLEKLGKEKAVLYGPAYKGIPIAVAAVFVMVDRREKGKTEKSAMAEISEEFGFPVYSVADVYDIIEYLEEDEKNRENVERIKKYLAINGARN